VRPFSPRARIWLNASLGVTIAPAVDTQRPTGFDRPGFDRAVAPRSG
jgi:hypothetical protein